MDNLDNDILELVAELQKHQQDFLYSRFMRLFTLLYERSKEGCLMNDGNQMYRQQGSALAMRELIESLSQPALPDDDYE